MGAVLAPPAQVLRTRSVDQMLLQEDGPFRHSLGVKREDTYTSS
jgi:hypothetical protein